MSFNPFTAPKNYSEMLSKIAAGTCLAAIGASWFLRSSVPSVDAFLGAFDFDVKVLGSDIPLGYVLPALVFAIVARIVVLHDRVSDLLGIRRRFDLYEILLPLAGGADVPVTAEKRERIRKQRGKLMGDCFYEYASSTKQPSVIDSHLISMALDQWHWYWIAVEALVVLTISAAILAWFAEWAALGVVAVVALAISLLLPGLRNRCATYAHREVEAILRDPARKAKIRTAFDAI